MKRKLLLLSVFAGVVAIAGFWSAPRTSEANTFNPFFGQTDFYSLSDTSPGGHGDIHAQFNVLSPSANFSGLFGRAITFGDNEVFNASAAQIPGVGAYMGQLSSTAYLGLLNDGCSSPIGVNFNFVEANIDTTAVEIDTPPGDGNPATSNDPLTLAAAINTAPAPGTTTVISYGGASGNDPLGVRLDPGGLITPVNEIQIDSEQMQIVDVDYLANTYTVKRGWNGTTPATHTVVGTHILRVNVIYPSGPNDNLLANMAEDDGDMDNNGPSSTNTTDGHGHAPTGTGVENADYLNLVSDGADAGLPSFIRNSYDPDGNPQNGGAIAPLARYYGVAFVANALIVTLQFVIAAPGALTGFPNLQWATNAWGYSSTTFLQDPLAPPSNSSINDFCNFTSNTVLYGWPHDNACTGTLNPPGACTGQGAGFQLRFAVDNGCPAGTVIPATNPNECGMAGQVNGICSVTACPRATNPATTAPCGGQAAGWTSCSVRYYQYAVSQRDYDNDGYDNALDVCFKDANPSWDARKAPQQQPADADGDGLPAACDPNDTPGAGFNNDQDSDGWQNRIDNCPVVPNTVPLPAGGGGGTTPNQAQYDYDVPAGVNVPDGGPASDSIGVECDSGGCGAAGGCTGNLDPNGANGRYHSTAAAQTICIGPPTIECSSSPGGPVPYSPAVTLTAAITSSQNQFNYTSTGDPIKLNDVLLVESERMVVGNVDTATNLLTVSRGAFATTAAAHGAVAITQTGDNDNDGVVNARDTCINGSPSDAPQLFPGPSGQDTLTLQANANTNTITVGDTTGFSESSPIVIGALNDGLGGRETVRYINAGGVTPTTLTFSPPLTNTHAANTNVAQIAYAQSLRDMDNDGFVTVTGDSTQMNGSAFSQGGDPAHDGVPSSEGPGGFQGRFDLDNDSLITVTGDLTLEGGDMFQRCGPP